MYFLLLEQDHWLASLILVVAAVSVLVTDLRLGRITNVQTYGVMAASGVLWVYCAGPVGILTCGCGLLAGIFLLLPWYLLGGLGAGDVKYLAAIGALMGWKVAVVTLFYGALIGGCMAFSLIVWKGMLGQTLKAAFVLACHPFRRVDEDVAALSIPFGVALALGSILATGILRL